jgi:hypothetical protein
VCSEPVNHELCRDDPLDLILLRTVCLIKDTPPYLPLANAQHHDGIAELFEQWIKSLALSWMLIEPYALTRISSRS